MHLLLVSLFLPQENATHAGGRHVFAILRQLATRHRVTLLTRYEAGQEAEIEALRPYCQTLHAVPYPAFTRRGCREKLRLAASYLAFSRRAGRLLRAGSFDLAQVEWVETALLIGRQRTPVVIDAHDVITKPAERRWREATGFGQAPAWLAYVLTRTFEKRIAARAAAVLTVSAFDRAYLERLAPAARVRTVPVPAGLDFTGRSDAPVPGTILFLASYRHHQSNVVAARWLARQVFPRVRARVPAARLLLAGHGPPPELRELALEEGIAVPGFVADLERCYREAAVFAAPILTGGGIIVKILDALAAGRPVVTTPFGNEGVGAVPGRDLLVTPADPEAFAAAVADLLEDPARAEQLGENGRAFVQARYSPAALLEQLEGVYGEVCER